MQISRVHIKINISLILNIYVIRILIILQRAIIHNIKHDSLIYSSNYVNKLFTNYGCTFI